MNARIEKKVSKRLLEVAPNLFKDAWKDNEVSGMAWNEGNKVSGCLRIGGEPDYWGEGTDCYSLIEFMELNYEWIGGFPQYPEGHKFEMYPDCTAFKPTTVNLIRLAKEHG